MISPPPSFIDIKNGFKSSFDFIRRKRNVDNLFELDNEKFWQSCWIVFFINALVAVLASYGKSFAKTIINNSYRYLTICNIDLLYF